MKNEATDGYFEFYSGDEKWAAFSKAYNVACDSGDPVQNLNRVLSEKLGGRDKAERWMKYKLPVLQGVSAKELFETEAKEYATRVIRSVIMSMP